MVMTKMFARSDSSAEKVYLSLLITDTSVQAGLWRVLDELLSIDSLSNIFDYEDEDSLLVSADQALQQLGPDSEKTDEVVFGFEFDWVTKTGLAETKKPLLKRLTSDLSLKSAGFVVVAEAVVQALRQQDQALNGLLVQFAPHQLTVTLVRQGKPVISEQVGRSDNTVSDLGEALARFARTDLAKPLPGKIMLLGVGLDARALAEQQQLLIDHDWANDHEFLYPPVIETLPEQTAIKAVIAQGGKAVLSASGHQVVLDPTLADESGVFASAETDLEPAQPTSTQSSFGVPIAAPPPVGAAIPPFPNQTASDEETAVDPSVDSWQRSGGGLPRQPGDDNLSGVIVGDRLPEETAPAPASAKPSLKERAGGLFSSIMAKVRPSPSKAAASSTPATPAGPTSKGHANSHPPLSPKKVIIASFIAGLLVLVLAGLTFGYVSREATITLTLNEEIISDDLLITLDPDVASSDPTNQVLKAQRVEEQVSGSDQITTTGAKLVGEEAKGTVTIFNKTEADKTFPRGTRLKAGSLEFSLDEEVKVASSSVSETPTGDGATKTYGRAEVSVTATTIGAESNLAAETEMIVDDFATSTYSATTKDALSGGSSREIRVVASEDRAKLLAQLREQLLEEAATVFEEDSQDGNFLLPTNQTQVTATQFSAEVGDETTVLELDLTLTAYAVAYQQDELKDLISQALVDQLQENYQLMLDQAQFLSSPVPAATDSAQTKAQIDLNVRVPSIPELDQAQLSELVAGRSADQAANELTQLEAINQVQIEFSPAPLRWLMRSLPADMTKIKFVFESDL